MKNLDLRDEIALKVLDGVMKYHFDQGLQNPRTIAANAYTIAEAVIEARELDGRDARIAWAMEYPHVL